MSSKSTIPIIFGGIIGLIVLIPMVENARLKRGILVTEFRLSKLQLLVETLSDEIDNIKSFVNYPGKYSKYLE